MKTIKRLKVIPMFGLSLLILCLIAYGSLRPMKRGSETIQATIKDTLIDPDQSHVSLRDSVANYAITFNDYPQLTHLSNEFWYLYNTNTTSK